MKRHYADLDVVNTRNGIEVIADLNDMPYLYRNKRHSLNQVATLFAFSHKDTVTFTKMVTKNVGKIIRIKVEDKHLKAVKPLREICSITDDRSKRQGSTIKNFSRHREDGDETMKYVDYFTDRFRLIRGH